MRVLEFILTVSNPNPANIPLVARTLLDTLHEMERTGVIDHLDCWDDAQREYYGPKEKLADMIRAAFVKKPWGSYQDLYRVNNVVVKRLTIDPGEQISLQRHQLRTEVWFVVAGEATVETYGGEDRPCAAAGSVVTLERGGAAWIYERTWHRLANRHKSTPLIVIEVQTGECDENDIERYEDKYGRPVLGPSQDAAAADGGSVVREREDAPIKTDVSDSASG